MGKSEKKTKKRYELAPNIMVLLPELELKADSERRDRIIQAQINILEKKVKKLDKDES